MLVFIIGFGLVCTEGLRTIKLNEDGFMVFKYADGGEIVIPDKDVSRAQYEEMTENIAYEQKMSTKHRRSHQIMNAAEF